MSAIARMFACALGLVCLALGGLCGLVWSRPGWSLGADRLGRFDQKRIVFCVTVVKLWGFGPSLKGLLGAQNQHPEIADFRRDSLRNCIEQLIKTARLRQHSFIKFPQTFINFWGFGCRFEGSLGSQKQHPEIADFSCDSPKHCVDR